jgi:hypothetical protein
MATEWRIKGKQVTSCNCAWGCPCQFNALPTNGHCEAVSGVSIREGHFGDVDLGGTSFAWILSWPGAVHEGNGTRQVIFDDAMSDAQREALEALHSAEHGGAPFEIYGSVCPNERDYISASIAIESNPEARIASIKVGEIADSRIEPIRNPVDDSEHRARIDLPGGFEYKLAEMGNTVLASSNAEAPLDITLENTYAQLNDFDWAPA